MFSGGDSSGQFGNFSLALQSRGVDWASLAQQWIQMRDGADIVPDTPPPPKISCNFQAPNIPSQKKTKFEEKGESDMEMDDDIEQVEIDGDTVVSDSPPPPAPSMQFDGMPQWLQQQEPTGERIAESNQFPLPSTTQAASLWNVWPPRGPPPTLPQSIGQPTAHIPSLLKMNVSNPNTMKPITQNTLYEDFTSHTTAIDAAKRKILPAWIREELEKLEREKQKQTEKKHPQSEDMDRELNLQLANSQVVKSKFSKTQESESSGNEEETAVMGKSDDKDSKEVSMHAIQLSYMQEPIKSNNVDQGVESIQQIGKSYEHKLADLMIVVRRILTELLLEVTNEEISNIAIEAIKARKSKASSAQVIRKSALSSITGKLGLSAYANSASGESSTSEVESSPENDENSNDSIEEIKSTIRLKRRTFAKLSEEIEDLIAANAAREEQKLKYYTQMEQKQEQNEQQNQCKPDHGSSSSYKIYLSPTSGVSTGGKVFVKDFGETTGSMFQHSNGKCSKDRTARKERTTRFSDNKDSITAATTYISQLQQSGNASMPLLATDITSKGLHVASTFHIASATIPAVDKPLKKKASPTSSNSSTNSNTTASNSSHNSSKYSRSSFSKHKRRHDKHTHSNSHHRKGSQSSYAKADYEQHESDRKRRRRKNASDSDDNERRSRHSSSRRLTSRRDHQKRKSRSRSRSPSSYTNHTSISRRRR